MACLAAEEHGLDVDLHHAAPDLGVLLHDGAAAADADIVVEEVQPAEAVHRRRNHAPALRAIGEIGLMRCRSAALRGDHVHGALGESQIAVDDENASAGTREQDGRGAAVADAVARRAATGDDSNLAGQAGIVLGACLRGAHG